MSVHRKKKTAETFAKQTQKEMPPGNFLYLA